MKALACVCCCTPLVDVLRERFGSVPDHAVSVSRWYPAKSSPTQSAVWWFDLPVDLLDDKTSKHCYLICRKPYCGCCSFDVLRIGVEYLRDNLDDLQTIKRDGETFVRLLLSAARVGRFTDLSGTGNVDLSNFRA